MRGYDTKQLCRRTIHDPHYPVIHYHRELWITAVARPPYTRALRTQTPDGFLAPSSWLGGIAPNRFIAFLIPRLDAAVDGGPRAVWVSTRSMCVIIIRMRKRNTRSALLSMDTGAVAVAEASARVEGHSERAGRRLKPLSSGQSHFGISRTCSGVLFSVLKAGQGYRVKTARLS